MAFEGRSASCLQDQGTAPCAGGWAWGIRQSSSALSWAPCSKGSPEGTVCSPHGDPLAHGKPSPRTPFSSTWEAKHKDWNGSKMQLLASKRELENKSWYCSFQRIVKQMFHFLQRWPQSCYLSVMHRRLISLICTSFAFQKMSSIHRKLLCFNSHWALVVITACYTFISLESFTDR